jgi:hypothetical protein
MGACQPTHITASSWRMLMIPRPHQWLDSNTWTTDVSAQRRHAIRLLADLAAHSEQVPDGHYLTGVKYEPLVPNWYGGYSDVHKGTWSGLGTVTRVVVKRLRVNEGPGQDVIHKVRCPSSCSPPAGLSNSVAAMHRRIDVAPVRPSQHCQIPWRVSRGERGPAAAVARLRPD